MPGFLFWETRHATTPPGQSSATPPGDVMPTGDREWFQYCSDSDPDPDPEARRTSGEAAQGGYSLADVCVSTGESFYFLEDLE